MLSYYLELSLLYVFAISSFLTVLTVPIYLSEDSVSPSLKKWLKTFALVSVASATLFVITK